jgi:hypothetical protein
MVNGNSFKLNLLESCALSCGLIQLNNIKNHLNRSLDLIFSNSPFRVNCAQYPLVNIDKHYPPLVADLAISETSDCSKIPLFNFRKANYSTLNAFFCDVGWAELFESCGNIDNCVDEIYGILNHSIELHCPKSNFKKGSYPSWYSSHSNKLNKEKTINDGKNTQIHMTNGNFQD